MSPETKRLEKRTMRNMRLWTSFRSSLAFQLFSASLETISPAGMRAPNHFQIALCCGERVPSHCLTSLHSAKFMAPSGWNQMESWPWEGRQAASEGVWGYMWWLQFHFLSESEISVCVCLCVRQWGRAEVSTLMSLCPLPSPYLCECQVLYLGNPVAVRSESQVFAANTNLSPIIPA